MDPVAAGVAHESALIQQELGFVILLSIAALVAIVSRQVRVPYTVALVVVGLILAFLPPRMFEFDVSSDLILALLVPPLVFEGTLALPWGRLRQNLLPILLLAVVGVAVGTLVVGGILSRVLGLPLLAALAYGALISATDPVAVIAFFRQLGVSKRLAVLVEGESLFNDGVAIVVFGMAMGLGAVVADGGTPHVSVAATVIQFLKVSVGGIGVGIVLGAVVATVVLREVDDHLIETATTVAVAFGSYVVAELLGVSGILAVVAAGIVVGNLGFQNTSPTTRLTINNFWEFLAFMANSLVFLIIGLQIDILEAVPDSWAIIVALVAVLLSRVLVVYSLTWMHGLIESSRRIPMGYRHVMFWGGLRGAISLALALTFTGETFGLEAERLLQHMAFGVVLFTLLVQGTTIERLIRYLRLSDQQEQLAGQQHRQARLYAARAAKRELDRLLHDGILSDRVWLALTSVYDEQIDSCEAELTVYLNRFPELELEMVLQARQDLLRAERGAVADAVRRGLVAEEVASALIREIDRRAAALAMIVAQHHAHAEVYGADAAKDPEV